MELPVARGVECTFVVGQEVRCASVNYVLCEEMRNPTCPENVEKWVKLQRSPHTVSSGCVCGDLVRLNTCLLRKIYGSPFSHRW